MDVEIKDKEKNKKEIKVTLSPQEVSEHIHKVIKMISSETHIDGFRPGMAPKEIIEEKVGKERIWQESCNEALKKTYLEIIEKNNFFIVAPPEVKIESMLLDQNFSYQITLTLMPEINLPDYKKIAKEKVKKKKEIEVTDQEVSRTLEEIQKSRAKIKAVDRESRKKDDVLINFQGSINSVPQEGLKAEKMPFVLGEQRFIEGFEDYLINVKQGDVKEFSLEMDVPETSGKQKIDFKVEILSVREREIPELNDDFAKSLGDFSGLQDLEKKIKENIKLDKEHREKEKIRVEIVEAINNKLSVEIPESMIDQETENMLNDFNQYVSASGMSLEDYLKKTNKTEQEIKKEWRDKAKKRISISLILSEIARKENIEISEQEIEQEANNYLKNIASKQDAPDIEKLKLYIKDIVQNEKVFKLLEEL
jgi:trigger factor